jgi:regulator of replication initiation timing
MKEQRGDYHDHIAQLVRENAAAHTQQSDTIMHMQEHIKGLVRDVDTLKIQMHNLIPVHNNMMDEILKQKAFLDKVQSILDRERDDRIKKTPGYKKEIAAMKRDSTRGNENTNQTIRMDKHVDMMVKKGRPRKP